MTFACPFPIQQYPVVTMAHGGGGRLTKRLLDDAIFHFLGNAYLDQGHDAARLPRFEGPIAMTTDSFVIKPLKFPGGDIGKLAVYGTCNDLAMAGAEPRFLSLGLILEEGLEMERLFGVLGSMREAADELGVQIVTGDTKVIERGRGDGLLVNTTGIGLCGRTAIGPAAIEPGDAVVLSGDIGRHGIAVMAAREGLTFQADILSDCASLWPLVRALQEASIDLHCLRDLTRGGLSAALHELADSAGMSFLLDEKTIPVSPVVRGACELLGLDAVEVANEGRFVAIVPQRCAEEAVQVLRRFEAGAEACVVGRVQARVGEAPVRARNLLGVERILDLPSGSQLPRIC